jgi:hypothetical protein
MPRNSMEVVLPCQGRHGPTPGTEPSHVSSLCRSTNVSAPRLVPEPDVGVLWTPDSAHRFCVGRNLQD